jgi:hypothetical protein
MGYDVASFDDRREGLLWYLVPWLVMIADHVYQIGGEVPTLSDQVPYLGVIEWIFESFRFY